MLVRVLLDASGSQRRAHFPGNWMLAEPEALGHAFSALHRQYAVCEPALGETLWRLMHGIRALPKDKVARGHWYRFGKASGAILVDQHLNGQWFRKLPADVDPVTVTEIPSVSGVPSLLDRMSSLASQLPNRANLESFLSRLAELAKPDH